MRCLILKSLTFTYLIQTSPTLVTHAHASHYLSHHNQQFPIHQPHLEQYSYKPTPRAVLPITPLSKATVRLYDVLLADVPLPTIPTDYGPSAQQLNKPPPSCPPSPLTIILLLTNLTNNRSTPSLLHE